MPYRYVCLALLFMLGFPMRLAAAPCADTVHADCLAAEIAAYRTAAADEFQRQRIDMSLARAQLAAGLADQARRTAGELEQPWQQAAFLADEAAYLLTRGNKRQALEALHKADELLGPMTPTARLNHTGTDMRLARLMAQAGAPQEGKIVLDRLADVRNLGMPMNPMLLALMLQVAQALADIGYQDDAAQLARSSFIRGFADDMQHVSPEQLFHLYAAWAKLDPGAAPRDDATSLAGELEKEEAWLFAGVVWAGPANAPGTSPEAAAGLLDKARKALEKAPERAAALPWQAKVAALLHKAGKTEQGQGLLEDVRKQAEALPAHAGRTQTQLELAKAQAAMGDTTSAVRSLRALADESRQAGRQDPMARMAAMNVPAELARLDHADDAYELAMSHEGGARELVIIATANRLALQGEYADALRFARELPGEQGAMVMAAMAARIAGIDAGNDAAP